VTSAPSTVNRAINEGKKIISGANMVYIKFNIDIFVLQSEIFDLLCSWSIEVDSNLDWTIRRRVRHLHLFIEPEDTHSFVLEAVLKDAPVATSTCSFNCTGWILRVRPTNFILQDLARDAFVQKQRMCWKDTFVGWMGLPDLLAHNELNGGLESSS